MSYSKKMSTRMLAMVAMLSAVASILMFFSFSVPFMPPFIKIDFSELPAVLAAFSLGPVAGVMVCLVKNIVNLFFSTTGGVGEFSNFILGVCFVFPAGFIYGKMKSRGGAILGAVVGALAMAMMSVITNYYVVYPIYTVFLPMEAIMGMYQALNPRVETLFQALLWFNMPFTFLKGMINVGLTFLIYKPISPLLKGK